MLVLVAELKGDLVSLSNRWWGGNIVGAASVSFNCFFSLSFQYSVNITSSGYKVMNKGREGKVVN